MQSLQGEVQNLKDQAQELHRDLTKHHSLIKAEIMADILQRSLQLDARIASEYTSTEGMRAIFQEVALPSTTHDCSRKRADGGARGQGWALQLLCAWEPRNHMDLPGVLGWALCGCSQEPQLLCFRFGRNAISG